MTISSTSSREDFTGNGTQDTFSYSFTIPDADATHLLVTERDTNDAETTLVKDAADGFFWPVSGAATSEERAILADVRIENTNGQ